MKNRKYFCDVLIIGSGVTGFATAMYSARFNLKTIVVGDFDGGKITLTDEVSNYPGFKKLTGMELANKIKEHALDYDVSVVSARIKEIKKNKKGFVSKSEREVFESKTIIYATGTYNRELGLEREKELTGKGVHTCALCDGIFYKNKVVGVVGGSDSAGKEAFLLAQNSKKVYIIYRGEKIRPEPINEERIKKNKKIEIINNINIISLNGEEKLSSVTFDKPYKGKKEFPLDAIFIEIGSIPNTDLVKNTGVMLNKKGEIKINRHAETNIPGFFAAGDCVDTEFKQAITGVAEGVTASYYAYQYIQNKK